MTHSFDVLYYAEEALKFVDLSSCSDIRGVIASATNTSVISNQGEAVISDGRHELMLFVVTLIQEEFYSNSKLWDSGSSVIGLEN
jgi:hypothetical protein